MTSTISNSLLNAPARDHKKSPQETKVSSEIRPTDQFFTSHTPSEFGQMHSAKLKSVLDPLAKATGSKSYSAKLEDAVRAQELTDADTAMLLDNLNDAQAFRKGSIPLKELYEIDQTLTEQAAAQAAKTTHGVLTAESARFLPQIFLADFQSLTGQQILDQAGAAVDGVSIQQEANSVSVAIEFEKALAGVTSREIVLGLTDSVTISASRLNTAQDPSLPPYWITISPREGKSANGAIKVDKAISSFSDPSSGQLILAGHTTVKLLENFNSDKVVQTLSFDLDKVNSYGVSQKPASASTQGTRQAWEARFSTESGGFEFDSAIASGALQRRQLSEVREQPGIKVLFSAIREDSGQSISRLYKDGLLEFAFDQESNSLAVLRRMDGESEQDLCVVDATKGRWVGTWSVGDDGTKEWKER